MLDNDADDQRVVSALWRFILASAVIAVGGSLTAWMIHDRFGAQATTAGTQATTTVRSPESLISLVADGKRHETKDGKYVVCDPADTPPECRTDLLSDLLER